MKELKLKYKINYNEIDKNFDIFIINTEKKEYPYLKNIQIDGLKSILYSKLKTYLFFLKNTIKKEEIQEILKIANIDLSKCTITKDKIRCLPDNKIVNVFINMLGQAEEYSFHDNTVMSLDANAYFTYKNSLEYNKKYNKKTYKTFRIYLNSEDYLIMNLTTFNSINSFKEKDIKKNQTKYYYNGSTISVLTPEEYELRKSDDINILIKKAQFGKKNHEDALKVGENYDSCKYFILFNFMKYFEDFFSEYIYNIEFSQIESKHYDNIKEYKENGFSSIKKNVDNLTTLLMNKTILINGYSNIDKKNLISFGKLLEQNFDKIKITYNELDDYDFEFYILEDNRNDNKESTSEHNSKIKNKKICQCLAEETLFEILDNPKQTNAAILRNVIINVIIKYDLFKKFISLFDFNNYPGYYYLGIVYKEKDEKNVEEKIILNYIEIENNKIINIKTNQIISRREFEKKFDLDIMSDKINSKHCVIIGDGEQFNIITDNNRHAIPDIYDITELHNIYQKAFNSKLSIDCIEKCLKKYIDNEKPEYPNEIESLIEYIKENGSEYKIKDILKLIKVYGKNNQCHYSSGSITKQFKKYYKTLTGNDLLPSLRGNKLNNTIYNNIIDINYNNTSINGFYSVGISTYTGMNTSIPNMVKINDIIVPDEGKNIIEKFLPLIYVDFVKYAQLPKYPFLYKYLNEAIKLDLNYIDGSKNYVKISEKLYSIEEEKNGQLIFKFN